MKEKSKENKKRMHFKIEIMKIECKTKQNEIKYKVENQKQFSLLSKI